MSTIFFDSNALVKRYLPTETGYKWIKGLTQLSASNVIVISELAVVETHSALARRLRDGTLTAREANRITRTILTHVKEVYLVVLLESARLSYARQLIRKHRLRTLDAIQLSCAIHTRRVLRKSPQFLSADNNLLVAATVEGLSVDNPLNHP